MIAFVGMAFSSQSFAHDEDWIGNYGTPSGFYSQQNGYAPHIRPAYILVDALWDSQVTDAMVRHRLNDNFTAGTPIYFSSINIRNPITRNITVKYVKFEVVMVNGRLNLYYEWITEDEFDEGLIAKLFQQEDALFDQMGMWANNILNGSGITEIDGFFNVNNSYGSFTLRGRIVVHDDEYPDEQVP